MNTDKLSTINYYASGYRSLASGYRSLASGYRSLLAKIGTEVGSWCHKAYYELYVESEEIDPDLISIRRLLTKGIGFEANDEHQ